MVSARSIHDALLLAPRCVVARMIALPTTKVAAITYKPLLVLPVASLTFPASVLNLMGQLSVRELMAVIAASHAVVSGVVPKQG